MVLEGPSQLMRSSQNLPRLHPLFQEALVLARVDTRIALAALASGGTRQVRAGGELPIHG